MALAQDLLTQARDLMTIDRGKPRQANLRRGISSAYYALFHLLAAEGVARLAPASPSGLASRIGRAFVHAEMKHVCKSIADGDGGIILKHLMPTGFSRELKLIATTFVRLQDARHGADYDTSAIYQRMKCIAFVEETEAAFASWRSVRRNDEANVFLAALLFNSRWGR